MFLTFIILLAFFIVTHASKIQRALIALDQWATAEPRASDIVLFTRPDIVFKKRGYELTVDMVTFNSLIPFYAYSR